MAVFKDGKPHLGCSQRIGLRLANNEAPAVSTGLVQASDTDTMHVARSCVKRAVQVMRRAMR